MKSFYTSLVSVVALILLLNCSAKTGPEPGVSLELAEFRKSVLSDIKYDLTFSIPEQKESPILASNTVIFNWKANNEDLLLDFKAPKSHLYSIDVNSTQTEINFSNEHLIIPNNLLQEGANSVSITFVAGETSLNRKSEFLYTLFVPDRARTAFPLFDQPNLKAVYKLTLETPEHWEAISNAPLANKTEKDSVTIWQFDDSDLISSYLFSFVAGEFQRVTRTINGREMSMLHRETDEKKVARNLDAIFELHGSSLVWLENYTNIVFPFQKFDFALIPSFQYGGMEHVGAIQYRASSLFLDENPSDSRLLGRASLIAHETAHMWFGDLVTMNWFNDVWTKEVFANFMAAKIVNPSFPDINHDLNFLVRHYPSAYSVDRTEGANAIRQHLPNLNEAGTMYGDIIYNKAPIMMRQLEMLVGEDAFQQGMQEYLSSYRFANATWPD
jgi:aminopeptidase N